MPKSVKNVKEVLKFSQKCKLEKFYSNFFLFKIVLTKKAF